MKGGRRQGSGRKPSGRITKSIRVDPDLWQWLAQDTEDHDAASISDRIDHFLRMAKDRELPIKASENHRAKPKARTAPKKTARSQKEPSVPTAPKIHRNDPCPCGSGRKFKRCCLLKA